MGRHHKALAEALAALPSPARWWADIRQTEREEAERKREMQRERDRRRPKCRCAAYPWPHRPKGGFCRSPEPPVACWKPKHECNYRAYRSRYRGIRRQLAKANNLHPIRDKKQIEQLMQRFYYWAKDLKRRAGRKVNFRNCVIELIQNADGSCHYKIKSHADAYG
jgi:hypothetical protein